MKDYAYVTNGVRFTQKEYDLMLVIAEGKEKRKTNYGSTITALRPKLERTMGSQGIRFTQLCCKFVYAEGLLPLY